MPCLLNVWITFTFLTSAVSVHTEAAVECYFQSVNSAVSLQEVINTSVSEFSNATSCVGIELPSGEHTITSQTLFPAEIQDIEFVGIENSVSVSCDYDVRSNYTWYFDGQSSVTLRDIHFQNCPRPLRIDTVANVTIQNCSFRYFTEAALDIFNCHCIVIADSILEHNTGTGIDTTSYRGNSGGVAFGYNNLPQNFTMQKLEVSNSIFRNNSATPISSTYTSEAVEEGTFTGAGGAMFISSNESHFALSIVITDCVYEKNYAHSGGGLSVYFTEYMTVYNDVLVKGTQFISNVAISLGGGLAFTFHMTIDDCIFSNNSAEKGGGVLEYDIPLRRLENNVHIRNTIFNNNHCLRRDNACLGVAFTVSGQSLFMTRGYHQITNCTFTHNSGGNSGIVYLQNSQMSFTGQNNFIENFGTTIKFSHSKIYLSGEVRFINNSGGKESALHMMTFTEIVFRKGLSVIFEGNSGRFGASIKTITITDYKIHGLFHNELCPFQYEDTYTPPQNWTNVTIRFASNTAILGSAIYMTRLDVCSWVSDTPPIINNTFLINWPIWQIEDSNRDTGYTESQQMNSTLSVQTLATRLVISNTTVRAWPGYRFSISVGGQDEFGHETTVTAKLFFQGCPQIVFTPEVITVGPNPNNNGLLTRNFTFYYGLKTRGEVEFSQITEGHLGIVTVTDPINTQRVKPAHFNLEAVMCPAGYVLQIKTNTDVYVCECNYNENNVILCEEDQTSIVIKRGKWAVYVPSTPHSNMEFYDCPMGYCQCSHDHSSVDIHTCVYTYSHNDPDLQCNCDRKGILCGECRDDSKGVSALFNQCVTCSNTSGLLILGLIIADAVVILLLLFLDIPLPSWTYPIVFCIQLAPVMGLNFPDSFMEVGKYLYFFGSASSFYFIYDFCLYEKMSSEMAYFLRYLPLVVAIVICTPVFCTRSWTYKVLQKRPLKYHGLWLVILFMYSHTVYTSITVLNCHSMTTDSDGQFSSRWYVNGEIECFSGGHIALALLAILVLLGAILAMPLILLVTSGRLNKYALEHLHIPLTLVYRDGWKWWASVDLGRRFLLILFTVLLPQNKAVCVLVLAVYTAVYGYVQPYRCSLTNLLEAAVNANFLLLLSINAVPFFYEDLFTFSRSESSSSEECGSSISGIAHVSWLLMPVYYLPLIGACVTTAVLASLFIRTKIDFFSAKNQELQPSLEDFNPSMNAETSGYHKSWTVQLPDIRAGSNEGFLNVEFGLAPDTAIVQHGI